MAARAPLADTTGCDLGDFEWYRQLDDATQHTALQFIRETDADVRRQFFRLIDEHDIGRRQIAETLEHWDRVKGWAQVDEVISSREAIRRSDRVEPEWPSPANDEPMSMVFHVNQRSSTTLYRIYDPKPWGAGDSERVGGSLFDPEKSFSELDPDELVNDLAANGVPPKRVARVEVPDGGGFYVGRAGRNSMGDGGAMQIIADDATIIPEGNFDFAQDLTDALNSG